MVKIAENRRPSLWPWMLFVFATFVVNPFLDPLFRLLDLIGVSAIETMAFSAVLGVMVGEFCFAIVICGLWGRHWLSGYIAATCLATVGWLTLAAGQVFGNLWEFGYYDGSMFAGTLCVPPLIFLSSLTLLAFRAFSGWRLTRELQTPRQASLSIADLIVCTAFVAALIMFSRTTWGLGLADWPVENFYMPIAFASPASFVASLIAVAPAVWILFRSKHAARLKLGVLVAVVSVATAVIVVAINQFIGPLNPVLLVFPSAMICVASAFGYVVTSLRLLRRAGYRLHTQDDAKLTIDAEPEVETAFQRWATPVGVMGFFVLVQLISWGFSAGQEAQAAKMRQLQRDLAARGGQVEVDVDGIAVGINLAPEVSRAEIQGLVVYPKLQHLKLANAEFEDGDLKLLKPLTKLQSLDLSGTSLTDAGLEELAGWSNIQTLSVAGTKCTAEGLKKFVERHPIYKLDIGHLNLTDADVNAIAAAITPTTPKVIGRGRLASGIHLVLAGNPITNDGLAFLKNSAHTWSLDLTDCSIDEGGLSAASYMDLNLDGTRVDLTFARRAKTLAVFSKLSMDRTEVTDAVLPSLGSGMIHHLKLGDTQVTEEGLSGLGLTGLRGLSLNSRKFTGTCFESWRPKINVLDMSHSGISDAEIKYIVELTGVYDLNLSSTDVTDACLATLSVSGIQTIDLSATHVTAMGLTKQDWQRKSISIAADQFTEVEFKMLLKHHRFIVVPPVVK